MFAKGPRITALGTPPPAVLQEEEEPKAPQLSAIAVTMGVTEEEYQKEVAEERKARHAAEGR